MHGITDLSSKPTQNANDKRIMQNKGKVIYTVGDMVYNLL